MYDVIPGRKIGTQGCADYGLSHEEKVAFGRMQAEGTGEKAIMFTGDLRDQAEREKRCAIFLTHGRGAALIVTLRDHADLPATLQMPWCIKHVLSLCARRHAWA